MVPQPQLAQYHDMIYITFSDVIGFQSTFPSLLSMSITFPLKICLSQVIITCYQWVCCEQTMGQPSFSKKTNHARLAFKVSTPRQFTLYVRTT